MTLTKDDLLEVLAPFKAQQDELAQRIQKMEERSRQSFEHQPAPPIVRTGQGRPDSNGAMQVDPNGRPLDAQMAAEMWLPQPETCPCGKVQFVQTQRFVGEQDIEEAQQAVVTTKGQILRQPWRYAVDPQSGANLVPEELRLTNDKRRHLAECTDAHSKWNEMSEEAATNSIQAAADAMEGHDIGGKGGEWIKGRTRAIRGAERVLAAAPQEMAVGE